MDESRAMIKIPTRKNKKAVAHSWRIFLCPEYYSSRWGYFRDILLCESFAITIAETQFFNNNCWNPNLQSQLRGPGPGRFCKFCAHLGSQLQYFGQFLAVLSSQNWRMSRILTSWTILGWWFTNSLNCWTDGCNGPFVVGIILTSPCISTI